MIRTKNEDRANRWREKRIRINCHCDNAAVEDSFWFSVRLLTSARLRDYQSVTRHSFLIPTLQPENNSKIRSVDRHDKGVDTLDTNVDQFPSGIYGLSGNAANDGEDLTVAFNSDYLLDGVEVADGDEVVLETVDALKPAVLQSIDSEEFLYLLMPVRANPISVNFSDTTKASSRILE